MPKIEQFGGLDNKNQPYEYGLSRCERADNVDFTRAGKVQARAGRQKLVSASIDAAAYVGGAILVQSSATLSLMRDRATLAQVASGLAASDWLSAEEVNGSIYWSNGIDSGVIGQAGNRPLGLDTPLLPAFNATGGFMPAGEYQYTITHVRDDGFESGAPMAAGVYLSQGGISLGANDSTNAVNLYLTTANGTTLYFAGQFQPGETIAYAGDTVDLTVALTTQFCGKPPAFSSACYYRGRMYYLHGNVIWASRPFNFELVDYARDFVLLPNQGAFCVAVDDGIYAPDSSDCYFLSGTSPDDFVLRDTPGYGAAHGSGVLTDAGKLGNQAGGMVAMWVSGRGVFSGGNSGAVVNVTSGIFAPPSSPGASAGVRDLHGQEHLVFSPMSASRPYNARKTSIVSIIRPSSQRSDAEIAKGELLFGSVTNLSQAALGSS